MKMSVKLVEALSDQVNREMYSSYLYLSMSTYCDEQNYSGCHHWLALQASEEWEHSLRLIKFASAREARLHLKAIAEPPRDFGSLLQLFSNVVEHEELVTRHIHDLYELALSEKDYSAQVELQWFIKEQVEEEKTAKEIAEHLKRVKDSPQGLISIDRWLAQRQ